MSDASDGQMSHADRHDLDKLARWKAGLDGGDPGASGFPACAIFLVSGEDRASHDIFRHYRSTFEDLGAGFHHLVIFGQHGVSTTQNAFLGQLGLGPNSVPALAIAPIAEDSNTIYCIELPKGDRDGDLDETQAWGAALHSLATAVPQGTVPPLERLEGVQERNLPAGTLLETVNKVLLDLGGHA